MGYCHSSVEKRTQKINMENVFPIGWDEKRVHDVIAYHKNRIEETAKTEAASVRKDETVMPIPHGLLSVVLELIEHYEQTQQGASGEAEPSATPFAVTLPAVVMDGQIKLLTSADLTEGTKLLITALSHDVSAFGLQNSHSIFDSIWNNEEDDVYAELLNA